MVNLPSHYIEHGVEKLITLHCFFGKIFGVTARLVPVLGSIIWPPGSCPTR
jgi:hypothetical protein